MGAISFTFLYFGAGLYLVCLGQLFGVGRGETPALSSRGEALRLKQEAEKAQGKDV